MLASVRGSVYSLLQTILTEISLGMHIVVWPN